MADTFVKDPRSILRVRQRIRVRVLSVDAERRRISFTLKSLPQ
jgi:uncharacterized protein